MRPPLCCPIHREPLILRGNQLHGECYGEIYPIVDGIPILISNRDERQRLAEQAAGGATPHAESALNFYNDPALRENYVSGADHVTGLRPQLEQYLAMTKVAGPVLEIGPGPGLLQGVGGPDYVALDYSIVALRQHIRPEYQRVCASAEQMPFPDASFRYIFTVTALEHVPEAGRAFDEIDRLLRPGGIAYLLPAWHCVQHDCEGIPVRPYRDLTLRQKWIKATLPFRTSSVLKALVTLPQRIARRAAWCLRKRPTQMRFRRLNAEYRVFWTADSDACSRLDSHEGCLYLHSRGYKLISPGSTARSQLLARHCPVVARKPTAN